MSDDWMPYEEYCDMVSDIARSQHRVYLNSDEWKEKREIVMKRDNYLCQDCLKISKLIYKKILLMFPSLKDLDLNINNKASQVHHLNYGYLHTPEEVDHCISLCEYCHKIKHSGLKYDYDKNVIKRNEHIQRILMIRLRNHPLMRELERKAHQNYLKSITMKSMDWLNLKKNEVENDKKERG